MGRSTAFLTAIALSMVIALFAAFYHFNDEPLVCDIASRIGAMGSFANTASGTTHYELVGAPSAPLIVLIHGVSGPMTVWDKTVPSLIAAGFRVLRYDLYGRGLSDRLNTEYNESLYDRQLFELLKALKVNTPVYLVGSSMGAIISAGFRNRHPDFVKKIALMGPAGFPIKASPISKLMNLPLIGEYGMGVFGKRNLMAHHWKYFYHPERFPEMHAAFARQLKFRGTKGAILSTMRHMPVQDFKEGYEKIGASKIPLLLLWGKYDVTFPFANHENAQRYMPQAHFIGVDGAAHLPQYEAADVVSSALISFFR